jgi:hypothetical protein
MSATASKEKLKTEIYTCSACEASCACVPQRDSIGLHNEGGRQGKFYLLYLLACAFHYRYINNMFTHDGGGLI